MSFADLSHWAEDDHAAALAVFQKSVGSLPKADWAHLIADIPHHAAQKFFETHFSPVLIDDGTAPKLTGYFEPEYPAAQNRDEEFCYPIYAVPSNLVPGQLYFSRTEIDRDGALDGAAEVLAWLRDPWDVFFLQVQGSGRLVLPDGSVLRVGFAGKNGLPYTSLGQVLIAAGIIPADQMSADALRAWAKTQPDAGQALLLRNESYVFFRLLDGLAPDAGPLGTLQVPLTPGRSLAVDPDVIPLGAPVWVSFDGPAPSARLMVAQDTGSAIKGAQRGDIYCGTGDEAGRVAGALNATGCLVTLLPHALADRLCNA